MEKRQVIGYRRDGSPIYSISGGDNIAVTPGAGSQVATDTRTISATSVEVQRVTPEGGTGFTAGHVDISTTAATIVAAKETRKFVTIFNSMSCAVYVGPATVTTSTGIRLDTGTSMDFYTTALIQGITAIAHTASGEDDKIHYVDFHD